MNIFIKQSNKKIFPQKYWNMFNKLINTLNILLFEQNFWVLITTYIILNNINKIT